MGKGLTEAERDWVRLADPNTFSVERSSKMANIGFQCPAAAPAKTTPTAMMWVVWNKQRYKLHPLFSLTGAIIYTPFVFSF